MRVIQQVCIIPLHTGNSFQTKDMLGEKPLKPTTDVPTGGPMKKGANTLRDMKFQKTREKPSEASPDDGGEDERQGKRPRIQGERATPGSSLEDPAEVERQVNSLSDIELTPATTPSPDGVSSITPQTQAVPTDKEVQATNFLARLQAKAARAAEAAPEPTPTTTRSDIIKYTMTPDGGFPLVYGRNSTFPFDNTEYKQLFDWTQEPGPCTFIQPLLHGYYPPEIASEIVGVLKDTIEEIFDCKGVKITAPIPIVKPDKIDHPPYTYLVRKLPDDAVARLVNQRCWAMERVAFLVYTAEPIPMSYLGAIQGFNATDDEDIANIRELIFHAFQNSDVAKILSTMADAAPSMAEVEPTDRARMILDTLDIRMISIRAKGGSSHPMMNLYMQCPLGKNDDNWNQLLAAVAKLEYRDSLLGAGTYYAGWTCTVCHGADHPAGLCPFPLIPGWINAAPIGPITDYRNQLKHLANPNFGQQPRGYGNRGGNRRGSAIRGQRGSTRGQRGSRA